MSPVRKVVKKFSKLLAKQLPGYRLRASLLRLAGYKIGRQVFVGEDLIIVDDLPDTSCVTLGDRVAIAPRVTLVVSSKPNFSKIRDRAPTAHGPIVIENDAWIGTGVIVMPNVTIGEGAVVGAGSIVTESVPPYTVVVGRPAKPHRKIRLEGV